MRKYSKKNFTLGKGALLLLTFLIAGTVFIFTYSSINKRTQSSFKLLQNQGKTLLAILTEATNNAISANGYFWESFVSRVTPVAQLTFEDYDANDAMTWLKENAPEVEALAVYQFDDHLTLLSSSVNTDIEPFTEIETSFFDAASALFADTTEFQSLVFLPDTLPLSPKALFLEIDPTRTKGICMALDFTGLWEMENEIGIGPLIQRLGEAPNVVYIFFQDPDGLIFSSTPVDSALAIGSDPFLGEAFAGDTLSTRVWSFRDQQVLEIVAPFSSSLYPDGLYRLGISLQSFNTAKSEFNRQMIALAVILFLIAALIPLYLGMRSESAALGASLARTQSLSATILESMRSGVIAINSDNSVELVNKRLQEMFALKDNPNGAPDWRTTDLALYLPTNIFTISTDMTAANDITTELEVTIGGEQKHFLYTVASIPSKHSSYSGKALVIYDYTHQRELEEDNARRERLVELGDLAAGVAHEIRNPLNAISLAAQRLDAEFAEQITAERKEFTFFTTQINSETKRLNAIVSRLLGLTRAPKAESQLLSIAEVVNEWIRFMQPEFERDSAKVTAQLEPELTARLDRDKLRQALGNLYRNSVEAFSGSLTAVTDSSASSNKLRITIESQTSDKCINILISDNGPGVPTETVAKLFTPYYTTKADGSGLGLSISFRLISDMGGNLDLDRTYTKGARFIIALPRK